MSDEKSPEEHRPDATATSGSEAEELRSETNTPGKVPGEGAAPAESGGQGGTDSPDSGTVGDTPTEGGGDGTNAGSTGGGDGSATGAGGSGGA